MIKAENIPVFRRILFSVLLIIFFLSIVVIYYLMLYSETRENIITKGRVNAIESANQIDKYLYSGKDILKLASYTLDNMLMEGRSLEEIENYLIEETAAVKDSLMGDTTGIYGFFYGQYLDGSGWQPEPGYNPTSRPWYLQARAGSGRVVIVDPYVDLDTGATMIAIVRTLCDARSVVGIDITLEGLQTIMMEHVRSNRSTAEFLTNSRGKIIVHSDPDMVGKDFQTGEYPLGALIAEQLEKTKDNAFYLKYDNKDYMVYVMPVENDWSCVTVIDATEEFNRLNLPLMITIIFSICILAVSVFLMIRSDRMRRETREMELKSERATAASEAKSQFLSRMSHEIRTPINAVLGMNEMILREAEDSGILSYAENIRIAGTTLMGIINDILDFSKIEAGKIEIIPAEYILSLMVNDLVNMIGLRAKDKGLSLKLEIDSNIPDRLYGDEVRIKQVITNILTNAVKYTEKGSITLRMGYERPEAGSDIILLKVAVEDTGIGIREEDLKTLFVEFERLDEKRNRHIEGTGLGMSITKNLLELMDSSLQVESRYGEGSVFYFTLPQKVMDETPMGDFLIGTGANTVNKKKHKDSFTAPDASVLMVDDNSMNIKVFQSLLKNTGMQIDTALSGDGGLAMMRGKKYDVIFLDHMMPGKDGIETLHELKADNGNPNVNTPSICLTANAIVGVREQYIAEGFEDYLPKPIIPGDLEEMLVKYLPDNKVHRKEQITEEETEIEELSEVEQNMERCRTLLMEIPEIDVEAGIKFCSSFESYMEMLKLYYESADSKIAELESMFEGKSLNDYTIQVHSMKSSLKLVGAMDLSMKAQKLEFAGKKGDIDYITGNNQLLCEGILDLSKKLSPLFLEENKVRKDLPEMDEDMLKTFVERIREEAEKMDCDGLERVFKEMDEYNIPEAFRERYNKIRIMADQFDYEKVLELLDKKL